MNPEWLAIKEKCLASYLLLVYLLLDKNIHWNLSANFITFAWGTIYEMLNRILKSFLNGNINMSMDCYYYRNSSIPCALYIYIYIYIYILVCGCVRVWVSVCENMDYLLFLEFRFILYSRTFYTSTLIYPSYVTRT